MTVEKTVLRISAACALALALSACNTAGERTAGGVLLGSAPGTSFVYEEYYPGCPDWRTRASVRSSSDAYACVDGRGFFRPRRGLVEPRYDEPPVLVSRGY